MNLHRFNFKDCKRICFDSRTGTGIFRCWGWGCFDKGLIYEMDLKKDKEGYEV